MPFSPIIVNSKTFVQSGEGRYMLSTVSFGDPLDYFKISGGSRNSRTGITTCTISRVRQKDVTIGGVTTRNSAVVSTPIQVGPGFTSSEVDAMVSDLSEFIIATVLDRALNGES